MKKVFFFLIAISIIFTSKAQVKKAQSGTFALVNALAIQTITNGQVKGNLLIQDGKIAAIGSNVTIPEGAEVIDCTNLIIYPGMIDAGSRLGLVEISSLPETQDDSEIGDIIPHMQALTAINPNSVSIPVTRVNGITSVLSVPQNGLFPGTAALINLHGYSPEQMFAGFKGVVLNFPSTGRKGFFDKRTEDDIKKEADKAIETLNNVWDKAAFYSKIDSAYKANSKENPQPEYYPEMAALSEVILGKTSLIIEVNTKTDIESALKWVKEKKIKNVIFSGVAEGWRVAEKIAEAKIPVLCGPILTMPSRESDRYERPYDNPGLLQKAGVKVAIKSGETENTRNLPYHAGFAAAYGMSRREALKAVTIIPAEIFGVADKLGSLEVGKIANIFVANGDPFETKTEIKYLFINGMKIPIDNRHIQLYEEFLQRSTGAGK
jgi:imidazolonepropionase-like amidohydrolase